jgi:hypothetical protein
MIPSDRLSTKTERILGFALAFSVLLWGMGCSAHHGPIINFTGVTGTDRFYNARSIRDFTLNLADGIEASCGAGNEAIMDTGQMIRQLRALAQNIDDAIDLFIDTPEGNDRVINAVNATKEINRLAYYKLMSCGGVPPEVPRLPGYYETFWDIAS